MHVRLHQFLLGISDNSHLTKDGLYAHLDEIDLGKGLVVSWPLNVEDGNDVLVVEIPKQFHLAQSAQTEHGMVKGSDLLDGHLLVGWFMQGRATRV